MQLLKRFRATIARAIPSAATTPAPPAGGGQTTSSWKLKSFVCVFRHGDRTPKNKLKITIQTSIFDLFLPSDLEDIVIRERTTLEKILKTARAALKERDSEELRRLYNVLSEKIEVPGTKLQLRRPNRHRGAPPSANTPAACAVAPHDCEDGACTTEVVHAPAPTSTGPIQIIVKWGGEFTHAGRHHSKDLGENMRKDLLILNKRILDDVKVMVSVERRVQATADVFCKSLVDTAELPPTMISTLPEALDDTAVSKEEIILIKSRLAQTLKDSPQLKRLRECLRLQKTLLGDYFSRHPVHEHGSLESPLIRECSESIAIFKERWEKHFAELIPTIEGEAPDPSRLSDLYDSLKYDALHHREFLQRVLTRPDYDESQRALEDLYSCAQGLFDYISPREYGADRRTQIIIGKQISGNLLGRLVSDLNAALYSPIGATDCRLYFTKESHMTALFNLIKVSGLPIQDLANEFDYLSHICFELYERVKCTQRSNFPENLQTPLSATSYTSASTTYEWIENDVEPVDEVRIVSPSTACAASAATEARYGNPSGQTVKCVQHAIRIGISNGAHDTRLLHLHLDERHSLSVGPRRWLTDHLPAQRVLDLLESVLVEDD